MSDVFDDLAFSTPSNSTEDPTPSPDQADAPHGPQSCVQCFLAACLLFVVGLGGAYAAKSAGSTARAQSLGNTFSAGVLVAGGFIHLLGDAADDLAGSDYPVAMTLSSAGFLATLVLSELAQELRRMQGVEARAGGGTDGLHQHDNIPLVQVKGGKEGVPDLMSPQMIPSMLLFMALDFHSLVEGLAMGVSDDAWDVFVPIVAHKAFAAFALGSALIKSHARPATYWTLMIVFAGITPAAAVFGCALVSGFSADSAYLIAIASGTFLYVGIVEGIAKEFVSHTASTNDRLMKISMVLLGWGLTALLAIWI